jgi:hypothetical protein
VSAAIFYRKHASTSEIVYSTDIVVDGGHTASTSVKHELVSRWTWTVGHVWPDVAFSL